MWEKQPDKRRDIAMTDIDALVPKDHLVRKIEKVMDYDWLYERLEPYYCEDNGRPGTDPVVLIKMVLIQHLFGIPSLRQTYERICDTISYRWFLGYGLLDNIPHFATVSYAFCKRFPPELASEIFEHILNKAINNKMVDPSAVFIDGTHIKASANKKKVQKEQVKKAALVYEEQLRREVNAEREKLDKEPYDDDDGQGGGTVEKAVSTTDPACGMYHKGEHEKQLAYEAHTACDRHGMVLDVEVTPGNVNDSVAFDAIYEKVVGKFAETEFIVMDAGYKKPWIAKRVFEDSRIPVLPYTRSPGAVAGRYRPWEYKYDEASDTITCPQGHTLRHTTTNREGGRVYRSTPKECRACPFRKTCGANEAGQRVIERHIWQEYIDLANAIRKTERGRELYDRRKETIERVFADAKEKHAMRYTNMRGLAKVETWVRLKFACMNLKKLATWGWNNPRICRFLHAFLRRYVQNPLLA